MQAKISTTQWQTAGLKQNGTSLPFANDQAAVKTSFASVLAGSSSQPETRQTRQTDNFGDRNDRAPARSAVARDRQSDTRPQADNQTTRSSGRAANRDEREIDATRSHEADPSSPKETIDATAATEDHTESQQPMTEEALASKFDELGTAVGELADLSVAGQPVDIAAFGEWLDQNAGLFEELGDLFDTLAPEELSELGLTPELQSLLESMTSIFQQFDSLVADSPEAADVSALLASAGLTMPDGQPLTMARLAEPLKSLADTLDGLAQRVSQTVVQPDQNGSEVDQLSPVNSKAADTVEPSREQLLFARMLSAGTNADDKPAVNGTPLVSSQPAVTVVSGVSVGQPASSADARVSLPFQTTLAGSVSDSAEWQDQFQQKLSWFLKEGIRSARLQLNPSDMGPIDVRIQMSKEQTHIQVFAQNPQVREMMEGSSQRLRELLASQNLELGGFDVSSQGRDGSSGQGGRGDAENGQLAGADNGPGSGGGSDNSEATQGVLLGSQDIRLVDHYV